MKRSFLIVVFACASSFAAQPASVIREGNGPAILPPERTSDAGWARDLVPLPANVEKAAPKKTAVAMTIDRSSGFAVLSEPKLGIDVDVRREGDDFSLGGYLKTHGSLLRPPRSLGGVSMKGGGVDVEIRPDGASGYALSGSYKKEDGSDGFLALRVESAAVPFRDFTIRASGLALRGHRSSAGCAISGTVDQNLYGKRELAVVGGALAALTDDLFR